MKRVGPADFDFSKGAEYRKLEPLDKMHVRMAQGGEKIITHNSAGKETENIAQEGDYIIKTSDKDDGYIITGPRFFEIYEDDPGKNGFYRAKIIRIGLLTLEEVRFSTPWGGEQSVPAGSVIIQAGEYIYGIDRLSFIRKQGRVDKSGEKTVFALLNEPLEKQLEKAQALNLKNHIYDIELRMKHRYLFD